MPFPSKQVELYQKLTELLIRYKAGSKLPPERELAKMLGVARMTLRETLDVLVQERRITRKRTGTFVLDRESGELPSLPQKNKNVYVLLPCPDYSVSSGYFSYLVTTECIRGAMKAAIRHGGQVITIPVSRTNDIEKIDRDQLSMLRKGDIVLFVGDWYRMLLPLLVERGCRIGAILPDMEPESEELLRKVANYRIFKRPMLANYLPEVLTDIRQKGKHSPLLFGRDNFSMFVEHPVWNLLEHLQEVQEYIAPGKLKIEFCPNGTSFVEQCAMICECYEKEPFDALIFDAETAPGRTVSLRKLCNLPEDVLIYVRGIELLGTGNDSRKNIFYSKSAFMECSQELTEQLLTIPETENKIYDFKHIITEGETIWKENQY